MNKHRTPGVAGSWQRARAPRSVAGASLRTRPQVLLTGALWLWLGLQARGEPLIVSPQGSSYSSIPAALQAAKPGDTIQVQTGLYIGNLVLDKTVTLEGMGKPVLRGTGVGSVLTVVAPSCAIRGFVIEHSGGDLQKEDSGILLKSEGNRVETNELRDVLYGIYMYRAGHSTIRHNVIRGRKGLELGERGAGLHLWDSPQNIIEDNVITEARDGLYIQSSPNNVICRNRVTHLRYGVHYMFSDSNSFEDNLFSENVAGAAIMYSSHISFRRNAFVHNRGFSSFGILFQECEDCLAEENFIIDNQVGVFMEALRNSLFRHNVIAENDVALQMFSSADNNTFTRNNFVENLSPLYLIGRKTTTRWESGKEGNFWSDYSGYDMDEDGIGDVPHKVQNVFDYLEGNFPRLRLYLESPAAQALATAEKTFPLIQGSTEVDKAPLTRPLPFSYPFAPPALNVRVRLCLGALSLVMFSLAFRMMWRNRRRLS